MLLFVFFKFGSQSTLQLIGVIEFLTWKKSTQTFFGRKWGVLWVKMIEWLPVDISQGSYQCPQIKSYRGYLASLIERTHACLLGTQADPVITDHEPWGGQVFGLLTLFPRSYSHLISFLIKNAKARKEPQVSSSIANPEILLSLSLIDEGFLCGVRCSNFGPHAWAASSWAMFQPLKSFHTVVVIVILRHSTSIVMRPGKCPNHSHQMLSFPGTLKRISILSTFPVFPFFLMSFLVSRVSPV